jgi:hypothetical protein
LWSPRPAFATKEIIKSNSAFNYSWVFNIKHKTWYKITEVWDRFINDFPVTYGYKVTIGNVSAVTAGSKDVFADNEIITADREEDSAITYYQSNLNLEDFSERVSVHSETRPLKFPRLAYKKLNRLLVEGYILNNEEYPFSVNLFGSPDNKNWYLLTHGNTFSQHEALLVGRSSFSCQMYILIVGGKVSEDAHIMSVTVDFEERYVNKLR